MEYIEKRFCFTVPTDLNLYYCGKRIQTKNHSYGPQVRDHFLIVYIKEGNAILTLRDKHFELSAGQVLCMFPNEKIYYTAIKDSLWSNLWLGLYGTHIDYYTKSLGITKEYPIYNCPNPSETERIIDEIIDYSEKETFDSKLKIISKLYDVFASLYVGSNKHASDKESAFNLTVGDNHEITYLSDNIYIREAENYIRFHYDSDITVHSLADRLNLSNEYFSRLFKSETGMTPQSMIIKYRIEKACTLLRSTNLSVSEIAQCVGLHDQRYFSKLFRQNVNCTPSEYRKQ